MTKVRGAFVLLLGALTAIGPLTIDLYLAAFPAITTDLATTQGAVQLTIAATLAGLAIGQLVIGSLSDALGRRRPLIVSLALYVAFSVAIVFAPSVSVLAVLRFGQGLTAAAGMVLSMAIVRDSFHGTQVGKVIARLMLVVGVAPILAPVIGAQLLLLGSWRMMFVVLAGFGLVLLALAIFVVPESLPVERRRSGGLGAALRSYGSLITDFSFLGLALLSGLYMAALFTYVSGATFVFQEQYGLSAQQFALVFTSGAIAVTAGSQINGALIGRVHPATILRVAVLSGVVLAAAMVASSLLDLGMVALIVLLVLTLLTAGFVMPSVPTIALQANPHRAGSAAALLGALQFGLGAAISPLSGAFGPTTALSMTVVMFGSIVAAAVLLFLLRRTLTPQPATEKVLARSGQ
ncbi:multidrug effflux MFS transporter [Nakamurella flavida]|uniref:Multidrug effflux MFS transporter n=1 Tax=Nakamurella flavida TaxID=363630 RepID=A0A939C522_9ACTN|nr:multidrug effflux MFS transporter [Nakamurella flavida]